LPYGGAEKEERGGGGKEEEKEKGEKKNTSKLEVGGWHKFITIRSGTKELLDETRGASHKAGGGGKRRRGEGKREVA